MSASEMGLLWGVSAAGLGMSALGGGGCLLWGGVCSKGGVCLGDVCPGVGGIPACTEADTPPCGQNS